MHSNAVEFARHPMCAGAPTNAKPPACFILNIGDELLAGDVVNTNLTFLAARARALGFEVRGGWLIRDRLDEIVQTLECISTLEPRPSVCLVSGGLGPTTDDLTAVAIAAAAGVDVRLDAVALKRLEAKFSMNGWVMAASNRKQANFPEGSTILPNPIGTAEGFAVQIGGCRVFAMPGVPRELKRMMCGPVEAELCRSFALRPIPRRVYRVLGMGESSVAELVEPLVAAMRSESPGLAALFVHYRASTPEVSIVLEGVSDTNGHCASEDELRRFDLGLLERLGHHLYGIGTASLASRVLHGLRAAGVRLATAESCTAGGVARTLAALPGASAVLDGGVIAYDNQIKARVLGVSSALLEAHGAVSEPVARAMAEGARSVMGSDLGVSVTGIAGPSGGTPEKPLGTVHIAVSDAETTTHKELHLRGGRGTVQRSAERWALKLVWDRLIQKGLVNVGELHEALDEGHLVG